MKIRKSSFYLSLFILIITFFIDSYLMIYIALVLIISVGILHGANDILLLQKTNFVSKKNRFYSVAIYSLVVIMAIAIFYYIPFYALLFFILFSAYHFGEQHLSKTLISKNNVIISQLLFFTFGLSILSMLFWLNPVLTNEVIFDLTEFKVPLNWYFILFLSSILISFLLVGYLFFKKSIIVKEISKEFILLLFYAVIFYQSPLILAFAVYFAFWHSLPSLADQIYFIYKVNFINGIKQYCKDAGLYWLVAIVGFVVFLYFFYESKLFYSFLFSFIAAITFPHVIVMGKMFSYLKDKS